MNCMARPNSRSAQIRASAISLFISLSATLLLMFMLLRPAYGAGAPSNAIGIVNVMSACFISLNPNTINFGQIEPSSNVPTNQLVQDADAGGNVQSNMLITATNWISGPNSFYVANTLWDSTNDLSYLGNSLPLYPFQTFTPILVPFGPSTSANVYFGLAIPASQAVGIYTQNIVMENSC